MRIALKRRAATQAAGVPRQTDATPQVGLPCETPAHPGLQPVWRDAVQAYGAQPLCLLLFSLMGFAGASMLGMTMSALVGGEFQNDYLHATGPLPTYQALGKIAVDPPNGLFMLLLMQGLVGWCLCAFSCGVMAHTVLFRRGVRVACRAVQARMPALLLVTLVNSALIGFGAVSINAGLRTADLDLSNAGQGVITPQGMLEKAMMHVINASMPAGSPFAEFMPYLQRAAFKDLETTIDYNAMLALTYNLPDPSAQAMDRDDAQADVSRWVIAGVVAIMLAQTLLCFGVPAVISARSAFAQDLHSVRRGIRSFPAIFFYASALQGMFASIKAIFIVAPFVLIQCLVEPQQWLPDALKIDTTPLIVVTISIVNALFAGFLVVFQSTLCLRRVGLNPIHR